MASPTRKKPFARRAAESAAYGVGNRLSDGMLGDVQPLLEAQKKARQKKQEQRQQQRTVSQNLGPTLGPAGQQLAARELRQQKRGNDEKQAAADEEEFPQSYVSGSSQRRREQGERGAAIKQDVRKLVSVETWADAASLGEEVGRYLRKEIAEGGFSAFLIVLLLSLAKDFVDFGDGGFFLAYIVGPFVSAALFVVFFMQKSRFKRWFIRKFVWRYIAMLAVGYIPVLAVMPEATVAAILLKRKADKRLEKLRAELKEIEKIEGNTGGR